MNFFRRRSNRLKGEMTETVNAILSRRSIRKYSKEPVTGEEVRILLEAAMAAPSAGNQQPWHFIVIDQRDILDKIPGINPNAQMAKKAPLAILVCSEPGLEKFRGYWVQDCSAATENILLAAHAMGLGAVWTGVYPVEERVKGLRELLGLPEDVIPMALVVAGRPGEAKPRPGRFNASRVHRNTW